MADAKTALLWRDLEEDIFMDCPEGLEEAKPMNVKVLKKSINKSVQAT